MDNIGKRKVQSSGNSAIVVIPKIVSYLLNLKSGDSIIFKNENNRIYIEKGN